jgi:hypothetical protein
VNTVAVGHAVEVLKGPEDRRKSSIAVFAVPSGAIKDGRDALVIRSESAKVTILGIDVRVR